MKKWNLLIKSFTFCIVFSSAAMIAMIVFFIKREEPADARELMADGLVMEENGLFHEAGQAGDTDYICIPLPPECTEDKIQITEELSAHKVILTIPNIPEDFFYRHPLSGNNKYIARPLYGYEDGTARIGFELLGFYECEKTVRENRLYLRFLPPKEAYSRIVVMDAGHGGEDAGTVFYQVSEKEVDLNAALKAGRLLEDAGIRVYYTRVDDRTVDTDDRIRLAEESQADMFISIHCNADSKTRVTKGIEILCGQPGTDLAECIHEELKLVSEGMERGSGRGVPVLDGLEIPAVMVQTGYLTNKQEALHLTDEKYLDKIAEGIYNGVIKAFEEMEK